MSEWIDPKKCPPQIPCWIWLEGQEEYKGTRLVEKEPILIRNSNMLDGNLGSYRPECIIGWMPAEIPAPPVSEKCWLEKYIQGSYEPGREAAIMNITAKDLAREFLNEAVTRYKTKPYLSISELKNILNNLIGEK